MTQADVDVVVRCKNEMPHVARTLGALTGRRVWFFDSGSTDGSREQGAIAAAHLIDVEPAAYVPGRVLNDAMRRTSGDVVAFVNADAVPLDDRAVLRLVEACRNGAAAAFGRQLPRGDARSSTRLDHLRAFPEDRRALLPGFFSMAASAVRRDAWLHLPFDESLRYSEDVDWTTRVRQLGGSVVYVPEARFEHSHDYDAGALFRRMRGEGAAERRIHRLGAPGVVTSVGPLVASLARDLAAGAPLGELPLRVVAQAGRVDGRLDPAVARVSDRDSLPCLTPRQPPRDGPLAEVLDRVMPPLTRGFPGALAWLLVGSFGAGEGVWEERDGRLRPHNDLDLLVVVEGEAEARALRHDVAARCAEVSLREGLTVDAWPVARGSLERPRGRLMLVDAAVRGFMVVHGDAHVAAALSGLGARDVAPDELRRLLVNRATGLAISRLSFERGVDEANRAARHVAKAWLAAGDALLIGVDAYPPTLAERLERLEGLATTMPAAATVVEGYRRAAAFRAARGRPALDARSFSAELPRLARAFRAVAPRAGTQREHDRVAMTSLLAPQDLPDAPAAARVLAGPLAALRGDVSWAAALRHPRAALCTAAVSLAFDDGPRVPIAALLRAASDCPSDLLASLQRLVEVAS